MSLAKIQLSRFTYKKDSGEVSKREIVVVEEGVDRVLALEIKDGDLTEVQPYLAYAAELEELKEHLKAKHGLDDKSKKLPFKSFLHRGISSRDDNTLVIDL